MDFGSRGYATGYCGLTTVAPACSARLPSDPVGLRVAWFGSQWFGCGLIQTGCACQDIAQGAEGNLNRIVEGRGIGSNVGTW